MEKTSFDNDDALDFHINNAIPKEV